MGCSSCCYSYDDCPDCGQCACDCYCDEGGAPCVWCGENGCPGYDCNVDDYNIRGPLNEDGALM